MALRIGKKKDAPADLSASAPTDDWSDAALLGQNDAPTVAPIAAPSPAVAPGAMPDSADNFVNDTFAPTPTKKPISPAILAGALVLLLTVAGVGAYFAFFNAPAEEEIAPIAQRPRRVAKVVTPTPVPVKSKTSAVAEKVSPGRAGIASPGTKTPALRSGNGKPPSVVPKPNMPTPVPLMPDGMAAHPGKGSNPGTTVQIVRPVSPAASLTPTLQAQLKALWKQGADAKHQRNYNGARAAWSKMLQLRPGHPGVQEAIEKLPR